MMMIVIVVIIVMILMMLMMMMIVMMVPEPQMTKEKGAPRNAQRTLQRRNTLQAWENEMSGPLEESRDSNINFGVDIVTSVYAISPSFT